MATILKIEDFANGRFVIPINPEQEIDLEMYIELTENKYLPMLFGKDLYDLFKAEIDANFGVPTSARFEIIFNPFVEQLDWTYYNRLIQSDRLIQSEGMKIMLMGFVYFQWVRDVVSRVSTVGVERTIGENSENVSSIKNDVDMRFNQSVRSYKAIQKYMVCFAPDDYPEFEGIYLGFNHNF
tara:strand:+ start:103 stop:648 length:546 start_codon:yes stop_codon:yes gene_type:complete